MSAAWMHMLDQICPGYDELTHIMEQGPTFIAKVQPDKNEYTLTIEEKSKFELTSFSNACELEKILSWTDQVLENWRSCRKISPNTWSFITQNDAEKFQTLFYLSWDQSGIR